MEQFFFRNARGEKLAGVLEMPSHSHNCPVAVLCHGFSGSKENPYIWDIGKALNAKGIAFFCFDFNAHGQSEGVFTEAKPSKQAGDLEAAIEKLAQIKKIDSSRMGLFGFSLGASTALLSAPKLSLKAMVLAAAVTDFRAVKWENFHGKTVKEWKENGFVKVEEKTLLYGFFEDGSNIDFYSIAKIIKCPTLVIHGEKDSVVPVSQSKRLFSVLNCEKEIEIIKGAAHSGMSEQQYRRLVSSTVEWLSSNLLK